MYSYTIIGYGCGFQRVTQIENLAKPSLRRVTPRGRLVGRSVEALASNNSVVKSHIINQQCKIILYKILAVVFNYQK
jgi:hypothetical protein